MPERVRAGAEARLLLLSAQIEKRLQAMVGMNLLAPQAAGERRARMRRVAERLRRSVEEKREERRILLAAVLILAADADDEAPDATREVVDPA